MTVHTDGCAAAIVTAAIVAAAAVASALHMKCGSLKMCLRTIHADQMNLYVAEFGSGSCFILFVVHGVCARWFYPNI